MAQATYIVVAACLVMLALGVAAHKGTSEEKWLDTEFTTNLWRVISGGDVEELKAIIETNPETVLVRSSDGRGPLWWAYEYHMNEIVDVLLAAGASRDELDADGKKPEEMASNSGPTEFAQQQQAAKKRAPVPQSRMDDEDEE